MSSAKRLVALAAAALLGCAHADRLTPSAALGEGETASTSPDDTASTQATAPAPPRPTASAGQDPQRGDAARLAAIRAEVDHYLTVQGHVLWDAWTRGAPPDLDASMTAHAALFARDILLVVREARDRAEGDERRALSLLHALLVGEHLARAADAVVPREGSPTLTWDGSPVPAWRVPALLASEPAPQRRAALEHAWAGAEQRHAADAAARWQAIADGARSVGYPSLVTLAAELRGDSEDALAALAEGVLAATDKTYRSLMDALARAEMNKPLDELRGRDLPRLLRSGEDRRAFPPERSLSDARQTFAAVGLDLARPGLVIDDEPRPGKDPRALTLPIRVPDDVRLAYASGGGAPEMEGLLHELGAAAYYAHVRTPVLEFRRLGTVTAETWSALFADLVGDPAWLAERTGAPEQHLTRLVRATAARRLHRARLLAARMVEEFARARDPKRAEATARARLERAMMRPVGDDELQLFQLERDPLLESADELRAILLAADAEAFLSMRSRPWWRSKDAGAWLSRAFAEGSRLSSAELARSLGASALDAAALAESTRARAAAAGLRLAEAAPAR